MKKYKTDEIKVGSKSYPKSLLDLVDPPETLFVRGDSSLLFTKSGLAVVGSRKMTHYGLDMTTYFVRNLIPKGAVVVSGFMYGVDTAAHKATLSGKGKTIAVLAHGLDYIYPAENAKLYDEIVQSGGCIVSEYPLDFKPEKWTFPKRNRIVAALSLLGTLVVEAAEDSGSLITAHYADALNRPLFAVPGPISSITSKGTNNLIKMGLAKMVTTPEDIFSV